MKKYDVIVIGGGCAGLACAAKLKEMELQDVLLIEKDHETGGILNQCIHNGFGLATFHRQLSGPSFAELYFQQAKEKNVEMKCGTMVTEITPEKTVTYVNEAEGYVTVQADAIVLTVGCYERNRGAIQIDGTRCAGVFTAGQAQRYVNIDGYMPGKRVFILGSGDIGLIMARRMYLEGADVLGVAEIMPYSNGLPRNIKQCLEDYDIPLYLSHTVTKIYGKDRLTGIDVCKVDEHLKPVLSEKMHFDCDTLLLSIGLIPENHLADSIGISMNPKTRGPIVDENYMTSVPGIFAAGNGLHVHDLADYAANQGKKVAEGVYRFLQGYQNENVIHTIAGNGVSYVVPGVLHTEALPKVIELYFRCQKPQRNVDIVVKNENEIRRIHKDTIVPSEMEIIPVAGNTLLHSCRNLTIEVEECTND